MPPPSDGTGTVLRRCVTNSARSIRAHRRRSKRPPSTKACRTARGRSLSNLRTSRRRTVVRTACPMTARRCQGQHPRAMHRRVPRRFPADRPIPNEGRWVGPRSAAPIKSTLTPFPPCGIAIPEQSYASVVPFKPIQMSQVHDANVAVLLVTVTVH